jgi:hypothetical protein
MCGSKVIPKDHDILYFGPPPPSGTAQVMSCVGVLMEQVLHYMSVETIIDVFFHAHGYSSEVSVGQCY